MVSKLRDNYPNKDEQLDKQKSQRLCDGTVIGVTAHCN